MNYLPVIQTIYAICVGAGIVLCIMGIVLIAAIVVVSIILMV